jgi:hypothetical protein
MEEQFAAILHTMKGDKIDQVFAAFTDEQKFVDWAEDYLKRNPDTDLFYTVLALNPAPGKMESKRFEIKNPHRESLFRRALREYNSL